MSDSNEEGKGTVGTEGVAGKNSNQTQTTGKETPKEGDKASSQLSPVDFIKLDVSTHPSFTKMQQSLGKQVGEKDTALKEATTKLSDLQSRLSAAESEIQKAHPDDEQGRLKAIRDLTTELNKARDTIKDLTDKERKHIEAELARENEGKKKILIGKIKEQYSEQVDTDVEKILTNCETVDEINRIAELLKIVPKGDKGGLPPPGDLPNVSQSKSPKTATELVRAGLEAARKKRK
jgi:hypothetical protein